MWEIAGEIDLPHFNSSCEGILATDTMQALSEFTRLPIANIFQVFEEIWTFIDIKITSPPTPNHCSHRVNLSFHLGRFLWDEDRSGIMHLALRDSCVRAFKRRITNMIKADRPFVTHSFRNVATDFTLLQPKKTWPILPRVLQSKVGRQHYRRLAERFRYECGH